MSLCREIDGRGVAESKSSGTSFEFKHPCTAADRNGAVSAQFRKTAFGAGPCSAYAGLISVDSDRTGTGVRGVPFLSLGGDSHVGMLDPLICFFKITMSPTVTAARIPHTHRTTTTRQEPRSATRHPHVPLALDIAAHSRRSLSSSSDSLPSQGLARPTDKVDSKGRTATSGASSRAHSRLASFGRIRSRASINLKQAQKAPASPGETPTAEVPVSPSDAGSHKRSDTSTLSYRSSGTTLSDDAKSDRNTSTEEQPSFLLSSSNIPGELAKSGREECDIGRPQGLAHAKPRTMHQTSSKLLRMTDDERPFTKDFKDLFSTLMVSLPLTPHRVRFTRIEHTFTTEEAMTNLGSLKFSQSNRMPDPKDPSRIVTTTTTTTFSMAKEMARSICQRFLDARFVESVDGKTDFSSRSSVWQLTPKGMQILSRFCQRNGISQRHVNDVLDSPRNMMQLVILEREPGTDKINSDAATVNVIFRRFAGDTGPNVRTQSSASDGELVNDYATGLLGVRMQRLRRQDRPYAFSGKAAFDWLMDCCTMVDKREVFELANLFMSHELVELVGDERGTQPSNARFQANKQIIYAITEKGMRVAGWVTSPNGSVNSEATTQQRAPNGVARDSNTNRMTIIIRDPALRLLFREYLRETHCEENLAFYVEVKAFLTDYEIAKRTATPPQLDVIRETLASAYSLYNAFLAPGSPCELNIDHNLRNALAARMTRAIGDDQQMIESLDEVAVLFDQAQSSVFKLMASDSVPKFSREPKYAAMLRERNLESMLTSVTPT